MWLRWILGSIAGEIADTTTYAVKGTYNEARLFTNKTYAYFTDKTKSPEEVAKTKDEYHASMLMFRERHERRKAMDAAKAAVESKADTQLFHSFREEILELIASTDQELINLNRPILNLLNGASIKIKLGQKDFLEYVRDAKTLAHLQLLVEQYHIDKPAVNFENNVVIKILLERITNPHKEIALRHK